MTGMWKELDGCKVWTSAFGHRFGEMVCVGIVGRKCVKEGVYFTPTTAEKKEVIADYLEKEGINYEVALIMKEFDKQVGRKPIFSTDKNIKIGNIYGGEAKTEEK